MKIVHLGLVHRIDDIRIVKKECCTLSKAGYEVYYLTSDRHGKNVNKVIDGVKVITVSNTTNPYKIKQPFNFIKQKLEIRSNMFKAAMSLDGDVYHIHEGALLSVGKKLMKRGKKVIYDVHEDIPRQEYTYFQQRYNSLIGKAYEIIFERYENKISKKFDFIVAATPFIAERFKKINRNTVVVNNYPLLNDIECNIEDYGKREKVVCYAGGISQIRGIDNVIAAMGNIEGKFLLAGSIYPEHKQELEKLDGWHKTEKLGFLNRRAVSNIYNKSLAGIVTFLPAPNHIYSQPNKLFEYMAAGIPVICSDFPSWKKIVSESNCGICVNPASPQNIANAINYIFKNKGQAQNMGLNGRRAVTDKYNWNNEKEKLLDIYSKLTGADLNAI